MKKSVLNVMAIMLFLVCSVDTALAWWNAKTKIKVHNKEIQSLIYNDTNHILHCKGVVYGKTKNGNILKRRNEEYIHPNIFGIMSVQTTTFDPFIEGWSHVKCNNTKKIRFCFVGANNTDSCIQLVNK